jgi:hypothetical protein
MTLIWDYPVYSPMVAIRFLNRSIHSRKTAYKLTFSIPSKLRPESFADLFSFESISFQQSQKKLGIRETYPGFSMVRYSNSNVKNFYMIYVAIYPLGSRDQASLSATNYIRWSPPRCVGTLQVPPFTHEIAIASGLRLATISSWISRADILSVRDGSQSDAASFSDVP